MATSAATLGTNASAQALANAYFNKGTAPPAGIYDINSLIGGMVDRGAWKYYDTLNIAQGTQLPAELDFFAVQQNAIDPYNNTRKTKLQTNMKLAGQFPPPRCLVLMQLGILFSNMLLSDIQLVLQNYYMEFKIDDKIFFEGRLEFYPCGYGVFGNSQNSSESVWGIGFPAPQATVRYLQYAKYIAPQQLFSWALYTPNTPPTLATTSVGGKNLSMVGFQDGITDRSVQ
jgi:hypothetical protein